ncbi:hypothetical protein ACSSZE_05375 [Acidithiobacillus caldus]
MSVSNPRRLILVVVAGALLGTSAALVEGGIRYTQLAGPNTASPTYRVRDADYLRPYPYPYPYGYSRKALRIYGRWKRHLERKEERADRRYWKARRKYDDRVYRAERKYDRSVYGY